MKVLNDYYIEQKEALQYLFVKIQETFSEENIHNFRTTVKKIRAAFLLAGFLSGGKFSAKEHLKKSRKLFKATGLLRELQVEELKIYDYENALSLKFNEYSEYLFEKEHREILKIKAVINKINDPADLLNVENLNMVITLKDENKIMEECRHFVMKKAELLTKINSERHTVERIHKNRTIIKQIYYLYNVLNELTGWNTFLGMNREQLKDREQLIGKWHDMVNSKKLIEMFFNAKKYSPPEKYYTLRNYVLNEKRKLKEDIEKQLFISQTSLWE